MRTRVLALGVAVLLSILGLLVRELVVEAYVPQDGGSAPAVTRVGE